MTSLRASRQLRTLLVLVLVMAWFGSLSLPAMTIDTGIDSPAPRTLTGGEVLGQGWIALFSGQFAWLGNFFLLPTLFLVTLERPPRIVSRVLAVLLILCTLDAFLGELDRLVGYYLWAGINLIAALAAFLFSANSLMDPDDPIRPH